MPLCAPTCDSPYANPNPVHELVHGVPLYDLVYANLNGPNPARELVENREARVRKFTDDYSRVVDFLIQLLFC